MPRSHCWLILLLGATVSSHALAGGSSVEALLARVGRPMDGEARRRLARPADCEQRTTASGTRVEACLTFRWLTPRDCRHGVVALVYPTEGAPILAAVGGVRCSEAAARAHLAALPGTRAAPRAVMDGLWILDAKRGPDGYFAELPIRLGFGLGAYRFGFGVALGQEHPAYVAPAAIR